MRRLFRRYIYAANRRGHIWELSIDQFHKLTSSPCFYCGKPPLQKTRSYFYNGIDRKVNTGPYSAANCVAACKECNFLKGGALTWDETKIVVEALKEYRRALSITNAMQSRQEDLTSPPETEALGLEEAPTRPQSRGRGQKAPQR